jgi:hypothetical protein
MRLSITHLDRARHFLVVTAITPFAASAPYNADALGPFSTSILSMLFGSI